MSLPNIQFIQSTSGLGRPLPGTDFISGYLHYYTGTLPSGFTANTAKAIYSVSDAENLGITDNHLGETASKAKLAITTASASGDTLTLTYTGINSVEVTILAAAVLSTNATASDTATEIAALINAGTATHGFSATASSANVLIQTVSGQGIFPNNGTCYAFSKTGTVAATLTNPTGSGSTVLGVASFIDIAYYHISEYFRIQPKGKLWVMFSAQETTYTFEKIQTLQDQSLGEIKQVAVYENNVAFDEDMCGVMQGVIDACIADDKPLIAVMGAEIHSLSDLADFPDLTQQEAPNVSISISADGDAQGYYLWQATGTTIGNVGALLGAISLSKVSDSIGWVEKFNMAKASELDVIMFNNSEYYTGLSKGALETLHDKGALFLRKFVGLNGSYWSDSQSCVTPTSDYATIENNRTYQKIVRTVRANMLPAISSPIKVDADGKLSAATIGYFESLANAPLVQMESNGELSAHKVIINPDQDVLATSTLELTLK